MIARLSDAARAAAVIFALALPAGAAAQRVELVPRMGVAWASNFTTYDPCPADVWCNVAASSPAAGRWGAVAGVSARAHASRWLAGETGLLYVQKGYAVTRPALHADYLEVPAIAHLELGGKAAAFFLEGGAAGAVLLRCRLIVDEAGPCDAWGMEAPARLDPQWVLGAGVRVGQVEASARVEESLGDIGIQPHAHTMNEAVLFTIALLRPRPRR